MKPLRIAMWSGPRNISTALMRSWGSRPDTIVCDEPLYAHYLWRTGKPHPGAEEVIRCHERDWRRIVERWVLPPCAWGRRHRAWQGERTQRSIPMCMGKTLASMKS